MEAQGPSGMDSIVELFLQGGLGLRQDSAFGRFLPGEIGKKRKLGFQVLRGDSIPKAVFEGEHLNLRLFDPQNGRMRQADRNLLGRQVHGNVTLEVETGFGVEGGMELHPFGAAGPGVE